MIFIRQNFYTTATMFTSSNGTSSAANLFDTNRATQYVTENAGSDVTTATFTIAFASTQTVSQVLLLNHNLNQFRVFYNGVTANSWANETTNSATSNYYAVTTATAVTSVTLQMDQTIAANSEKTVGEFIISNLLYDFSTNRLPTYKEYQPKIAKQQFVHQMSDGGTSIFNLRNKFSADLELDFAPTATVASLKTIYDLADPVIFVPAETSASWDGEAAEVVWTGPFTFLELSHNNRGNGFSGKLTLRQTPGGSF